ncbi:hypothetical protein TPHA_0B02740 [Tetrapisispora phaffii CBS 4417]|uniref:Protein-serine/threonine kinase n=1 Tax=Tetrapisispora phaffii (strain ATCC 24235 / CBS 4417 / NBRC 1672 / NRRL Y-8282 / UCD 70-5) TaxID=1071381 RepID=G8BPL5_TETPH|nr:hypothetical protein TPHA_0B02740 [Tetrapisispora phaffii CBS 4417]CCE61946.1 hypothetical protein TPHA_0B02740 [Tetrapisispora phaffii CBS 4417]
MLARRSINYKKLHWLLNNVHYTLVPRIETGIAVTLCLSKNYYSTPSESLNTDHITKYDTRKKINKYESLDFNKTYDIRTNIELLIQDYANKPIPPLSYDFLTSFKPPLTDNDMYMFSIRSINLLLAYTSRRLKAIQNLPYIAVVNPNVEESNSLYLKTLTSLLSIEYPYDLHYTEKIKTLLTQFLDDHQDTLVTLSKGLQEINEIYSNAKIIAFLNDHLRDRIAMKLIATHYLTLIEQSDQIKAGTLKDSEMVGVLHRSLSISALIKRVSEFVGDLTFIQYDRVIPVKILTGENITFPCIPTNLEYVLTEVIKNASRAHIESRKPGLDSIEKPIEVSIFYNKTNNKLEIRICDFGGGIKPDVEAKMWDYSYSTVEAKKNDNLLDANLMPGEDVNSVCGMGFGLPLCRAYLKMFDDRIDIQSLLGWGTDVYIHLNGPSKELLQ